MRSRQKGLSPLGLLRLYAHIISVGQCSILIYPLSTLSLMKKYLAFIFLVRLDLDRLALIYRRMVDILSWYMMFWSAEYPFTWMKYILQSIFISMSSAIIRSASINLFILSLFFPEYLTAAPFTKRHHGTCVPPKVHVSIMGCTNRPLDDRHGINREGEFM